VALTSVLVATTAQAEQVATVADGDWSDPAVWGGSPPDASQQVSVRHRVVVDVDITVADVFVRRGGSLRATSPVLLDVPGAIVAQDGSILSLHGPAVVDLDTLAGVRSEDETTLTVEPSEAWAGELSGAQVVMRGGRGRTWRFAVAGYNRGVATLTLPYPNRAADVAGVDVRDPGTLDLVGDFVRTRRDQVQGRWAHVGGSTPSRILGVQDIEGADRVVLWPPAPAGATRVQTTYAVQAGDRYSVHRPVRLVTGLVYAADGARVSLRRVQLEGGFVQFERTTAFELVDSDLFGANPGCFVLGRDVTSTRIIGNHIHDVSPDSDLLEHGGQWRPDQQRGHGICLYGADHLVADNLLTNLNDDMIYIGASTDVTIRDNVTLGSGVYHGNSFECITAFQVGGHLEVSGNVAGGSQLALLFEDRAPGSTASVHGNLLLQDDGRAVLADRSGKEAGLAVFRNNVFVGAAPRAVYVQAAGAPALYEGNYFHDLTVRDALHLRGNLLVSTGRVEQPLLRDPHLVESNLFLSPTQRARHATVLLGDVSVDVELRGNSFDPGLGAVVRHEPGAGARVRYLDNLSVGPLIGFASRGDEDVVIAGNVVVEGAVLWEEGSALQPRADGNRAAEVAWQERSHLLPACDPAAGYARAGVASASEVPLASSGVFAERVLTATSGCEEDEDAGVIPERRAESRDGGGCATAAESSWPWWRRR
jgi:hypothetical protein